MKKDPKLSINIAVTKDFKSHLEKISFERSLADGKKFTVTELVFEAIFEKYPDCESMADRPKKK